MGWMRGTRGKTTYLLLLVGGVLGDEERDAVVDTALSDECVKCVLDGNVEGIKLKVLPVNYSPTIRQEKPTCGPMYSPRLFQSASAVSSVPVAALS